MPLSDGELVNLARAGDNDAYTALVLRHQSSIRGWLRQLTGGSGRADELAQDTFVRAWENLDSFRGQGQFRSWLMKIAYREFLGSVRKNRRLTRLVAQARQHAEASKDPGAEALTDLERMLATLSPDERDVMVLCYGFGCSHSEAGKILGKPLGTIKARIHRSKSKLRERFRIEPTVQARPRRKPDGF
jgi:RNA polymerase sigma-70 factor (ECF subfamily)